MTRHTIMRIVLIAGSILIIIGVILMVWMLSTEEERNVISIFVNEDMQENVEFENLCLIPGQSCEYVIRLKENNAGKYDLKLDFIETEEKTLKNFAYLKMICDGEVLYDELLAKAFEDDDIVLPFDFSNQNQKELKIVYYLPSEVGNEAKNAEAIFELQITASNE